MRRFFAALALVALIAAGCGDDTDNAATDDSTAELTGTPYKVAAIVERAADSPRKESHAAAKAAATAVNKAGGINGRPVEVTVCDAATDANSTSQCARDIVNDPDVVAVVGMLTNFGDGAVKILAEAGIASIGHSPVTLADYGCTVCFPVNGGTIPLFGGQAALIADKLGNKVNIAIADVPAGQQIPPLVKGALASRGSTATVDRVVPVPYQAADVSAQVATASGGSPSGIMLALPRDASLSFIQTAKAQGVKVPMVSTTTGITADEVKTLGAAAEDLYLASSYRVAGPAADAFETAMDAADKSAPKNDTAKTMWISVKLFADVAKGLPQVDRKSVLDAMGKLKGYETGLTPALDFTKPFTGLGGRLPRVFNTTVVFAKVENGKVVELDGGTFVDAFAPPAKPAA